MPPRKKQKKTSDKEYGEILVARLAATEDPMIGTPAPAPHETDSYDGSCQVRLETSFKTGTVKGALVTFYNGRGRSVACYIENNDNIEELQQYIGKAAKFGVTAMSIDADLLTGDLVGIPGLQWFADDEDDRQAASKLDKKPTMKWVTCRHKRTGLIRSTNQYLLIPTSAVTLDSWSAISETDRCISIDNPDDVLLGQAVMQRAVFALSREEAKFHPDPKYHGERRKWADV